MIFVFLLLHAVAFSQTYERAGLWQQEIDALTEIDQRQTPPREAVLFVGSSSIRLWKDLRADFPSLAVVNRGFGGSHLEDVLFYFDRLVTPVRARKIVLYAGENDIFDGKTPERVLADFQKFVALAGAKSPKSKVYFVSLKPSPSRWALREKMEAANRLIKAECEKSKKSVFVDVWSPMLNGEGAPKAEIFVADRLHMNRQGYEIWRAVLGRYL